MEQSSSKACALVVDIHAEPGQERYWLGIATGALARPAGGRRGVELGHAPGVMRDDSVALLLGDDEESRCTGRG